MHAIHARDTRERLENLDCTFAELGLHFNGPSRFTRFLDTLSRDVLSRGIRKKTESP